jgi:hypothetical protein
MRGLGGVGDARSRDDRLIDGPELRIDATLLFGGFGISSDAPQRDDVPEAPRWTEVYARPS